MVNGRADTAAAMLRRKLPGNHDLADIRADELPAGQAFVNFEKLRRVGSAQAHDLAIDRGGFRCRAMSAALGHIRRVGEPSALF